MAGQDTNLGLDKLEAGKRLANKLWQASRFGLSHIARAGLADRDIELNSDDAAMISELSAARSCITTYIEEYRFDLAAKELRQFFWGRYCDYYIELAKDRLYASDASALLANELLLEGILKMFHPFMPFITEHIWQQWHISQLIDTEW